MTRAEIKKREEELIDLTGDFCEDYLDYEYLQLCEKLIKKLGRKRDVPFQRGGLEIWAASIIHALGIINFLFDESFEPFIDRKDINDYFGTKQKTVTSKSKQIRDLLKLKHYDNEFSTQMIAEDNPFNDLIFVDGYIVPINQLPENLQALVRQERAEGRNIEFRSIEDDD